MLLPVQRKGCWETTLLKAAVVKKNILHQTGSVSSGGALPLTVVQEVKLRVM